MDVCECMCVYLCVCGSRCVYDGVCVWGCVCAVHAVCMYGTRGVPNDQTFKTLTVEFKPFESLKKILFSK